MAKKARVYDGTAWQELASAQTDLTAYSTTEQMNTAIAAGVGLVPILTQTIGTAVSSVVVNNAFSADYDAYKIFTSGGVASGSNYINVTLTGSTSNYNYSRQLLSYAGASDIGYSSNSVNWSFLGRGSTNTIDFSIDLIDPFAAKYTKLYSIIADDTFGGRYSGQHKVAASYTGFTLTPTSGTLTGGTIYVYGYQK